MILKILCERGQNRVGLKRKEVANLNQSIPLMILGCQTEDMLFWERGSIYVNRKEEKALDPRAIWIRYDRGRPPEDLGNRKVKFEKIKQDK